MNSIDTFSEESIELAVGLMADCNKNILLCKCLMQYNIQCLTMSDLT